MKKIIIYTVTALIAGSVLIGNQVLAKDSKKSKADDLLVSKARMPDLVGNKKGKISNNQTSKKKKCSNGVCTDNAGGISF